MLKDSTNGLAVIKTQAASAASDAAAAKTAAQGITGYALDSTVAKAATIGAATDTAAETTSSSLFAWVKKIRDYLYGIVTTSPYATETNATSNKSDIISAVNGAMDVAFLANGIQSMANMPAVVIIDGSSGTGVTQTLDPNTLYVLSDIQHNSTLTLGPILTGSNGETIVNEYHILINVTATCTISIQTQSGRSIVWAFGQTIVMSPGYTYEIGILNNNGSVDYAIYNIY